MKVRTIWFFMLFIVSLFITGCTNNEVDGKEAEVNVMDSAARNAVLDYLEKEDWNSEFYQKEEWENASVKKVMVDDNYKNIDKEYMGKEIFVVTIADALAAPLVYVDPETLEVIGIMPGE